MAKRVTIVIEPSDERGGFLTVQDAMLQVLDFIEVVTAAASDDTRQKFNWRLVSASTNSPFTATAEAFSVDPEWEDVASAATFARGRVKEAFDAAQSTGELPNWLEGDSKKGFQRLFERNLNGISKTAYTLDDESPPVVVIERRARHSLNVIEHAEVHYVSMEPDYSGEELGSVEGNVLEATTHYGKPALRIRDRLTDAKIICVIPPDVAERVGSSHNWNEVWKGQRVIISGRIKRDHDGVVVIITADEVSEIAPPKRALKDVADKNFTGGKEARKYLDELWGDDIAKS